MQQVTIQLQASLLEKLRHAAFDDDYAITDFTYLVDAADGGRDKTIAVLHEFKQRLIHGTSREDFHSPHSSRTELGVHTPTQTPPLQPPVAEIPLKSRSERTLSQPQPPLSFQHPAQRPSELKKHPTWQRDFRVSPSDDGDTTSGAEEVQDVQQRHKKRNSLLHFLKHTRTNSTTDKNLPDAIAEATAPTSTASSTATTTTTVPLALRPSENLGARHSHDRPTRDRSNTGSSNVTNNNNNGNNSTATREARFTYEDWEDNPSEIWGARPSPNERRETLSLAPNATSSSDIENFTALHHAISNTSSLAPPSSPNNLTLNGVRTASIAPSFASFGAGMAAGLGASNSHASGGAATAPQPCPDNEFLGLCKSSWKLQNGDKKGAFTAHKQVEPWSRHPGVYAAAPYFLACNAKSCLFRSSHAHTDVDLIWRRVFTSSAKGIRVRWRFLAKSHVVQKVVVKGQFSFKCLFCVFLGVVQGGGGVYHGVDLYLDHINYAHRGQKLNDVVLYKTGCVMDRVADDGEDFDINLWPGYGNAVIPCAGIKGDVQSRQKDGTEWLSDDLLMGDPSKSHNGRDDSMFSANEPWNEGLSDFHYRGEYDRTELE